MRTPFFAVSTLAFALALAACSDGGESVAVERVSTVDVAEAPAEAVAYDMAETGASPPPPPSIMPERESPGGSDASEIGSAGGEIAVSLPQIAYRYSLGFRLPANAIKPLQERHADMCEARGTRVCRIISMKQTDEDGDYSYGSLQLAVASGAAREFSKELEKSSDSVDGELVSSSIDGEDLSKQIVDTEARLRARSVLRDRLMEVLRTRRGTVRELVEAERGVAQVNQEIDQAQSWLTEMRGRVAFSQMSVTYESGTPSAGGFAEPIRGAWNSLGSILGSLIAFLMLALTVVIPLAVLVYGGVRLARWVQSRSDANGAGGTNPAATQDGPHNPDA